MLNLIAGLAVIGIFGLVGSFLYAVYFNSGFVGLTVLFTVLLAAYLIGLVTRKALKV